MTDQRIDPVLVEKARERFDEIVGVADGEGRVFDDDRRVIGEFWDALDRQQKWFDELELKEERQGRGGDLIGHRVDYPSPRADEYVRYRSDWRPVEQGDANGD